jgi:hypothetical protein
MTDALLKLKEQGQYGFVVFFDRKYEDNYIQTCHSAQCGDGYAQFEVTSRDYEGNTSTPSSPDQVRGIEELGFTLSTPNYEQDIVFDPSRLAEIGEAAFRILGSPQTFDLVVQLELDGWKRT